MVRLYILARLRASPWFHRLLLPYLLTGCVVSGTVRHAVGPPVKSFRVSGYVLDSLSHQPVAGVFVTLEKETAHFGVAQTDQYGHFTLRQPASRRTPLANVAVQTVLYAGRAAIPADTATLVTIWLRRTAARLPADDCAAGTADTLRMKPYASTATLLLGSELAFLVPNDLSQRADTMRTLVLDAAYLQLDPEDEDYRVRFYQPNGPEHGPGTEVLGDYMLLVNLSRTGQAGPGEKKGRYALNVRELGIPVPRQGVFVGLQAVVTENLRYWLEQLKGYTPTGRLLRPACTVAASSIWYDQTGLILPYQSSWCPLSPAQNPVPFYHLGVQVELVEHK